MRARIGWAAVLAFAALAGNPAAAGEGPAVKGRIVDEDGKPVEGANVSGGGADLATGKDGLFSFPAGPGPLELRFRILLLSSDPWPRSLRPRRDFRLFFLDGKAGRDLGDIPYGKWGCLLRGVVLAGDGTPAAGARVALATGEGLFIGAAVADAKGAYRMKVPLAHCGDPGYSLRVFAGDPPAPDVLEIDALKAWEENAADVRCAGSRSRLEGTATLDGAPLAGARVFLFRKEQKSPVTFYPVAETDERGRFAFDRVPAGACVVHVAHPRAFRRAFPAECPCAPLALELAAGPTGAVEGYLRITIDGQPYFDQAAAEDAKHSVQTGVFAASADWKPLEPLVPATIAQLRDGGWAFRVENLPEGEHRFLLRAFQACDAPSALRETPESRLAAFGECLLHEGGRVVRDDAPSAAMGIELRAVVKKGETARIEVRKNFPMKEIQALMEKAGE